MPQLNDREYYAARATRALQLHANAADPEVAAIHRRMADSYLELAEMTDQQHPTLRIVSG